MKQDSPCTIQIFKGREIFILSIGMAVDANVLIFERIKDELRSGNTLIRSIETGFSEAFSSIVDGHLTTLSTSLLHSCNLQQF